MYLISAYFDENANKILQSYFSKIAEATGNRFMIDNQVPPHMTISAIEARSAEALQRAFDKLGEAVCGGKIQFVSVGQLLPYVIYTTPVLNQYLTELSFDVYNTFQGIPETKISKYYQPYSWLPHVTLGKTLDKQQMQQAFVAMQNNFVPFEAAVQRIGIAKMHHGDGGVGSFKSYGMIDLFGDGKMQKS